MSSIAGGTTYSVAAGNLLGVVDSVSGASLDDGEFDVGDMIAIGGTSWRIDQIRKPTSSGTFQLADGTTRTFSSGLESNLDVVFLTVSAGGVVRHFIIPNDRFGDMDLLSITTGSIGNASGSDAGVISTVNNRVDIVCFTFGTRIETAGGVRARVETLVAGDRVRTADHGDSTIRWIGSQRVAARDLLADVRLCPIRIEAGALGAGYPAETICLSPQHRVLVGSRIASRMFAVPEVLVAAKHLVGLDGVSVAVEGQDVTYFHFLLDRHEIVFANGLACESLLAGSEALRSLAPEAREEILGILPGLGTGETGMVPCRPIVGGRQARRLTARHVRNGHPILSDGAPGSAGAGVGTASVGSSTRGGGLPFAGYAGHCPSRTCRADPDPRPADVTRQARSGCEVSFR